MKIIGVIPARWQSSRFPGKPLAHILGKSLILRTYENSLRCRSLDSVVIATDDQRIMDHAQEFGAKVFMTSNECLTGTDRVWEVVSQNFEDVEIIVNIQGDEPCLAPSVIDSLVNKIQHSPDILITTPVAQISDAQLIANPHVVKCVFDRQGKALYFSRSAIPFARQGQGSYYRHLGVYCFRSAFLRTYVDLESTPLKDNEDLEQLKILEHGFPIHVCIVEDQANGVDTPEDLKSVENFLCQKESMCL
jgi:3-deoxy-manno-octulosonate cytidylyltransferase (CMP-KDO synthetase)